VYKFANPHEWLSRHLEDLQVEGNSTAKIVLIARELASKVDADTIQDMFGSDMREDGYFDRIIECVKCRAQSTEEEWNEYTKEEYGEDFEPIHDGVMRRGCVYVCPENGCHVGIPI